MARTDDGMAIDRKPGAAARETFAPFVGLDVHGFGDRPFRFDAAIRDLPEIPIFSSDVCGLAMERTPALIAADGKAGFALTILRSGTGHVVQRNREACVASGEAVLTTGADVVSLRFPADVAALTIMPSRAPLAALVPNLDDLVARPIPAGTDALRLLACYTEMVQRVAPDTPGLRHLVATHLFDLTALAIGAIGDAAAVARGRGLRAARLATIKQDIDRNLAESALSIGTLAARHRVSPRYIAGMFAEEHTTFSDFVRGRRLERARRILSNPARAYRTIGEVAYACGFNDLSYFNRCFRSRYAATPGEVRSGRDA